MKKLQHMILMLALVATAAGCNSASAPPVELPAPVTGQIDISAPNAEGKSTITGSAGAVPGGSYVLVINERLEAAQNTSSMFNIVDALVPSAYAASLLPDTCDLAGHWCVVADEDGSFVLTVDAYINDSIIIVLINGLGYEISERLVRSIPASDEEIAACPNKGVNGKLAALANPDGIPLGLYEGSDDSPNTLSMTDTTSGELTEIPLPGCYASGFAFLPFIGEGGRVVAISSEDKLMWIGTWDGEHLIYSKTFNLQGVPVGVTSIDEDNYIAVAFEETDGFSVGVVSAIDGSTAVSYDIPNPTLPMSATLTRLIAMTSIGTFADGSSVIGLLTQTDALDSYITLLDSTDLNDLGNIYLVPGTFFFTDLTDMEFATGNNSIVYALIDNHGDGAIHVRGFTDTTLTLALTVNLAGLGPLSFDSTSQVEKDIVYTDVSPRSLAVNYDSSGGARAYVITGTDSVIKLYDFLATNSYGESFFTVAGASTATDIATNTDNDQVVIGNGTVTDITGDLD